MAELRKDPLLNYEADSVPGIFRYLAWSLIGILFVVWLVNNYKRINENSSYAKTEKE